MFYYVKTKGSDPVLDFIIFSALGWIFKPYPIISLFFYFIGFAPIILKLWDLYDAIKRYFKSKQAQK